ncbi:hypothetical protein ACOMHN_057146 [Nucella lapillus]
MSDEDKDTPYANRNSSQTAQSPHGSDSQIEAACTNSPSASTNPPSAASTPDHLHSGLTSGPRVHPSHGDRPSSAPPHRLEKLSGVILRIMGDHYQSSTYGQTLRLMGDQMTFETEIRRALSYSDLDRLQNNSNR